MTQPLVDGNPFPTGGSTESVPVVVAAQNSPSRFEEMRTSESESNLDYLGNAIAEANEIDCDLPRSTTTVWDVPFDRLNMSQCVDAVEKLVRRRTPSFVVTANLNYCMLNESNRSVQQITRDADLILADGQPIVWRSRLAKHPLPCRVAGSELISHLCQRAAEQGWRVYFLGGLPGVAEAAAETLQQRFPRLQIAGTESPPFRDLTPDEQFEQDMRIQSAGTDLLFVAFGQPKGEQWIHENYQRLKVPVSIQLGASFDFLAGTSKRAPQWCQKIGMEWLHRMLSDPKRLVPRYAGNAAFLCRALVRDWRRKVTQWGMGQWEDEPTQTPTQSQGEKPA